MVIQHFQRFITHSLTCYFRVQPTADPDVHHADRYKIPYSRHAQPYFYPVDAQWALQSSVADPGYFGNFYPNGYESDQPVSVRFRKKDPLTVAQIYDLFGRLLSIAALVTQTATATVTNTVTTTVTTTTNTVVISGCKPPGITYNPC